MARTRGSTATREADPSLIEDSWTFYISVRFDNDEGVFVATCEEHRDLTASGDTEEEAVDAVAEMLVEQLARSRIHGT